MEKRFIQKYVKILEVRVSRFERRYGDLYFDLLASSVNNNSDEGDRIVFVIYCILNCNFCLQLTSTEEVYSVQQAALVKVFDGYKAMEIMKSYTNADGRRSFHVVTRYTYNL